MDLTTDPERALLGQILQRPKALQDVEGLDSSDFAQPRYAALWDLMQRLDSERVAPDLLAVADNLHRIELPGMDATWLADVMSAGTTWQPSGILSRMIRDAATMRRLEQAGMRIIQHAQAGGDPQEIQEIARTEVDAASRAVADVAFVEDRIDATLESWESPAPPSVPTPWDDLNEFIGGWRAGALYVIGARPSVGKSLMGLQAAVSLAEHGLCSFHSLEMPEAEVHTRLIAQISGVPQARMDRRELTASDWQKIATARGSRLFRSLVIDDRGSVRGVDIRSVARTLARRGTVAGVVVDYLQLMTPARSDKRPRHEQVGEWTRGLKLLAKDMNIPVILLSQLNRDSTKRTEARPVMADLKASGDIEQDADVILLLHAESKESVDLEVIIEKNRQGQCGKLDLVRRGHLARLDTPGAGSWTPSRHAAVAS